MVLNRVRDRVAIEEKALVGILELSRTKGYPPSYRELSEYVGCAHSNIWYAVEQLRSKGFVTGRNGSGVARVLTLTRSGAQMARGIKASQNGK